MFRFWSPKNNICLSFKDKKILITGVSGLIGNLLAVHLKNQGHEITALNRSKVTDFESIQADISNLEDIQPAFNNKDLIIHMSAYTGGQSGLKLGPRGADVWQDNLNTNIIDTTISKK